MKNDKGPTKNQAPRLGFFVVTMLAMGVLCPSLALA